MIVGGNAVSYGAPPASGGSWRALLLKELEGRLDGSRIHFVGRVPHSVLHALFQVTACHVYLTYPFVLSWSLLEAMSCGAFVVASATPPVQEVIRDGVNGRLIDFFDKNALVEALVDRLSSINSMCRLALAARETIVRGYDLHSLCLPRQLAMLSEVARNS